MKAKLLALLLLATLFIMGCSKKLAPNAAYGMLQKREIVKDLKAGTPFAGNSITTGKQAKFKLALTDSVMQYTLNGSNIRSNFKDFFTDTKPNTKYKLTISSLCDCLGFKKYLFLPALYVFDTNGQFIKSDVNTDFNYLNGPLSLNSYYTFNSGMGGNLKLVVFSANQNLNQSVYKFVVIFITAHVRTNIGGDYNILLEEIK